MTSCRDIIGVGLTGLTKKLSRRTRQWQIVGAQEKGADRLVEACTLLCNVFVYAQEAFTKPRQRRAFMPDQALTDQEQLEHAAGRKTQQVARRSSKKSLTRSQPLSLQNRTSASEGSTPADKQQQQLLLEHLQQVETLPSGSRYAMHRKACILKALSLLTSARCHTL